MSEDALSNAFLTFRQMGYPLSPETFEAIVLHLINTNEMSADRIAADTIFRALVRLFSITDWTCLPTESVFLPSRGFPIAQCDRGRCTKCKQLLLVPSDDHPDPRCTCPGISVPKLLGFHAMPDLHSLPRAVRIMGSYVFQVRPHTLYN